FDTPETLFFSRRIVDPQFGARLTGKIGGWAIGLLGMDDRAANTLDHKQLTQELSALPGVHAAAIAVVAPLSYNSWDSDFSVEGYTSKPGEDVNSHVNHVSPGFFATLRLPMHAGRDFTDRDTGAPK